MKDPYVKVSVKLVRSSRDAFMIEDDLGGRHWVPFSVVGVLDENAIKNTMPHTRIRFQLREWKAKELRLLE